MGEDLVKPDVTNPQGYFESQRLAKICMSAVDHPSLARRKNDAQLAGQLRQWGVSRQAAHPGRKFIGAKYPALACMGGAMTMAWKNCRFVVVDRASSKVVESILRTPWGWTRDEADANHQTLLHEREKFIATCRPEQCFRIDFELLRKNPETMIRSVIKWLEIAVTDDQIQRAIAHVIK